MNCIKVILFIALGALMGGCGKMGKDPLVGRWQEVDGKDSAEYFADGTAIYTEDSLSVSGKWKRLEDGRLKVEATVLGIQAVEIYTLKLEGDSATFTDPKGKVQKFRRVAAHKQS